MRPADAAKELGISDRQLRDLSADGAIPYIDVGRGDRPAGTIRWIGSVQSSATDGEHGPDCRLGARASPQSIINELSGYPRGIEIACRGESDRAPETEGKQVTRAAAR